MTYPMKVVAYANGVLSALQRLEKLGPLTEKQKDAVMEAANDAFKIKQESLK